MMEGITILNKIEVTGLPTWLSITWLGIFAISLFIMLLGIIALDWGPKRIVIVGGIAVCALTLGIILTCTVTTGKYRYECIISDAAPYNYIVENYEIIEQRGDIWVLEDKS